MWWGVLWLLGFFLAVRAIDILRAKNNRTIFVGIAGPSGAGKTSLARKIASIIPKTLIIAMDNYLDSTRQVIDGNFDDFRLVDHELLNKNLSDLSAGNSTDTPLYDFRKSGRYAYKKTHVPESKVVIVEGIYALHDKIRGALDLKISVQGGVHFDLIKRIVRDTNRTGQEPKDSIRQITETVYPMYKAFIEPDLANADIRIVNQFNPFSGLLNPIYTLKSAKRVTLDQVKQCLGPESKHTRETYYDIYLSPPQQEFEVDKDHSVTKSESTDTHQWIRVRNNNGQYILLFSEIIRESGFIISPRIEFSIDVRTLGGLMALGYKIAAVMHRSSDIFGNDKVSITLDEIQQLGGVFVQIKGASRDAVQHIGDKLGLGGTYIPLSYIEMYSQQIRPSTSNPVTPLPAEISNPPAIESKL